MNNISNKRVLVVGGTAGIGLAIARRALIDGAHVVISGRDASRGANAVASLDNRATFFQGDAGDPASCADVVARAANQMGGIDALFCSSGGNPMPRLLKDIPLEDIMGEVNRSLAPTILPARAALPVMTAQAQGSILCIASDAGKLPTPGEVPIGAAMAAIIMFCRAMANEVKRQGIRVNCLTPSIVEGTELHDRLMENPFAGKLFAKAKSMAHLGVAQAEDLAEMAVFLAGPGGAKITGQAISITGGISTV
jgi:NAD(P)-dependent dehydrogenase (short-subunit alcohol dehydrogenase family)